MTDDILRFGFAVHNKRVTSGFHDMDLAKWQTVDPIGYPDGWNPFAYCGNRVIEAIDYLGCKQEKIVHFDTDYSFSPGFVVIPWYNDEWDAFGFAKKEAEKAGKSLKDYVNGKLREYKRDMLKKVETDNVMRLFLIYFSSIQEGPYHECPPSDTEDPWKHLLEQNEADGWHLEYGPYLTGLILDYDSDVTNAGIGALIVVGCTHHWEAKFVEE